MTVDPSRDQTTSTNPSTENLLVREEASTSQPMPTVSVVERPIVEMEMLPSSSTPTASLAESVHQLSHDLSHDLSQIRAQVMSRRGVAEITAAGAVSVSALKKWAVPLLVASISFVYIWFGALKIVGASPVAPLVQATFPQFPEPLFLQALGIVEVIIGVLMLNRKTRMLAVLAIWVHLGGIFFGVAIHPNLYFAGGNILTPGVYGEFVAKNIVLLTGSLVILVYRWRKQPTR